MLKFKIVKKGCKPEVIVAPSKQVAIKRLLSCDVHDFKLIEDGDYLPKLFQIQPLGTREKW